MKHSAELVRGFQEFTNSLMAIFCHKEARVFMERKQYYAIDIAKFISAFFVICIHTGPLLDISVDANFVLVQVISRIAVPLFFIASGFLMFEKIDLQREWNDYDNISVIKHYIGRIFKLYMLWTILYLPFSYMILRAGDGITLEAIIRYIRDFFFTGSFYHLWFLPALMLSVFVSYVLLSKFKMSMALLIAFVLYVLGMFGNVYPKLLEQIPVIDLLWKMYVTIFATTRNGLFFGTMFITLGAYFSKQRSYLKRPFVFVGFLISLVLLFVECYAIKSAGYMSDIASMYILLIPCVSFLFSWILRIQLKKKKIYKTLRQMSLLIYVSHIMFVSILLWTLPSLNSLIVYVIVVFSSLLCSYVVLWLSRRIKVLKALY